MTTTQILTLADTRFGDIEYTELDVFTFESGLIGFPSSHHYLLLVLRPETPFRWLQSIEEPGLAFLLADPAAYVLTYAPEVADEVAESMGLSEDTPRLLLTTANIPRGRPRDMTLNLAGPILFNLEHRTGCQVVLEDEAYTTRYRVFQTADDASENVAA